MKSQDKKPPINLSIIYLLLSSSFLLVNQSFAQDSLDEAGEPLPETEIVCFAAKKQWVCAPAGEQEKAQEKALKLLGKKATPLDQPVLNSGVEIQAMEFNDEVKPVAEQSNNSRVINQDIIDQQTKDFKPRAETPVTAQAVDTKIEVASADAAEGVPEEVEAITPINTAPKVTIKQASNNFNAWQQNHAEKWSFQVVGTSNRHHLEQFINDNGLSNQPHSIVKTQANGADWWIVLTGLYDSREEAISQRSQLPAQLFTNAWVRQINTIVGQAD